MANVAWRSIGTRLLFALNPFRARSLRRLIAKANRERDTRHFAEALPLFEEAVARAPWRSDLRVQAGHMAKEARRFDAAEAHYLQAERARPSDGDLQLQLGHFYKTIDRLDQADVHYRKALRLIPDCEEARQAIALYNRRRGRGDFIPIIDDVGVPAPELLPGAPPGPRSGKLDEIVFRRLGNGHIGSSIGDLPVFAGIEALRGVCVVEQEISEAIVAIDDGIVHRGNVRNFTIPGTDTIKAVFNLWIDCTSFDRGVHRLELVLRDISGRTRSRFDTIYIMPPPNEQDRPLSDAVITQSAVDVPDLEGAIRARPSMVHRAGQAALATPRSILVLRTDQLGDMVVSLPALMRLRALFPDARIVGLVTEANADLARSFPVFDEVIAIDFPDDFEQRKRVMSVEAQHELQARLSAFRFDLAIDLALSHVSRPLLKVAGARFTLGFDDATFPWLDAGVSGRVRAPREDAEASPHAGRLVALIERLATLVDGPAPVVRRPELECADVAGLGINPAEPYIVMHTGARVRFSRWPHFRELAEVLRGKTGLAVMVLGEPDVLDVWGVPLDGVRLIDRRLPFDDLDWLLSHASLFIGNDSGPKHLAALRGVPVVSVHSARIHWLEWGQQQTGLILSRQVPCAGCAIFHDEDECGKDFACVTDIRVSEVAAAAAALLDDAAGTP